MNRKNYILAVLMLLMPLMAGAQALKGSYFMDNSLNRNELNPAFAPRSGYFNILLGDIGVGALTDLKLQSFIYPKNGELYTFLHKDVSVEDFEASLGRYPHIDANLDMNVLSFGFFAGKSFWTFDAGLKVDADIDVPRDLFTFLKKGAGESGTFNIGALRANALASAYASLGFSRPIVKGLRVGARARVIAPMVYAGVNLNDVSLTTSPDKWTIKTDGTVNFAANGIRLMDDETYGEVTVDDLSPSVDSDIMQLVTPAGIGYSFDFGAEYRLEFDGFFNGVAVSAAVTDLGKINYKASAVDVFTSKGEFNWEGFKDVSLDDGSFDGVTEELGNQLMDLTKIQRQKDAPALSMSTLPSFYAGLEIPLWKKRMSFGALYSYKQGYFFPRQELTASFNFKPAKWFALGVNYSFLNVDKTFGWLIELTPRWGPCLYVGSDYTFFELVNVPDGLGVPVPGMGTLIPTTLRQNIQFGLSLAIGGGQKNKEKKDKDKDK